MKQKKKYNEKEILNIAQDLRIKLKSGVLKWQDDFEFDLEEWLKDYFEKNEEIEKKEKLINHLFIGKVSNEIGFNKTIELLKESRNAFLK